MLTTLIETKQGNTDICVHNAKEVAAFAAQVFAMRQKSRGGTDIPTNPRGQWDSVASQMVGIFKCHTSPPIHPATAPISLEQLQKGGIHYHFQGTFGEEAGSHQYLLGRRSTVYPQCMCQWCGTEILVPTPRRSEEEEEIDVDLEQLTTVTQRERKMSQARGDSMLKLTANRETLIHRASEPAEFSRTVENGAILHLQ